MSKSGLKKTYRILSVIWITLIVALLCVVAFLIWQMTGTGEGKPAATAAPTQVATVAPTNVEAVVMRSDLLPDAAAYYRQWTLPLYETDGQPVAADAFLGKPLVLLYWASWCTDCQAIVGEIETLAHAAEAAGARFEMVARTGVRNETAQTATDYLANNGIKRTTLLDLDAQVYHMLGLRWVPTLLYFSVDGRLMTASIDGFTSSAVKAGVAYATAGGASATWQYISDTLIDEQGGIAANYTMDGFGNVTPGNECLSESTGIAMMHALAMDDQATFDRVYDFLRPQVLTGMVPWRWADGKADAVNATLDDLRLLEALLEAQARWGDYREDIRALSEWLLKQCAPNGNLIDHIYQRGGESVLTLCYVDVQTLRALAMQSEAWVSVAEKAQQKLEGGLISVSFPLYTARYSYDKADYLEPEFLQMNEAMVTVYHLARAGLLPEQTQTFLRNWLKERPIFAAYTGTGTVVPGYEYESTATYGMLVLIGCALDDVEMARLALYKMEQNRIIDADSPANGSYAYYNAANVTFDSLIALQAWDAIQANGWAP